jgi:hypothetical protein
VGLLGPLLFSLITSVIFFESITTEAIWRGPGFEPVIRRAERPTDYYAFLALIGFLAAISLGAFLWLCFDAYRRGRQADP